MSDRVPVLLDTDIGGDVDDALALALALASPEVELAAVSVGHGDAALIERRARTAAALIRLAGRDDVPVLRGVAGWLSGSDAYRGRGEPHGLLDGEAPPARSAVAWLAEEVRRRELHVVAIGPFTTVATALREHPEIAGRLRGLTVMGGFVHPDRLPRWWREHPEEATPALDYNTQCDPVAALQCATSGVAMTWVTIETTLHTQLTRAGLERLQTAGTPLCTALAHLVGRWSEKGFRHRAHGQPDALANLHDPLALASLLASGAFLDVREEGLTYRIEDGWFRVGPEPAAAHRARVSQGVDAGAFEQFFLERVTGL